MSEERDTQHQDKGDTPTGDSCAERICENTESEEDSEITTSMSESTSSPTCVFFSLVIPQTIMKPTKTLAGSSARVKEFTVRFHEDTVEQPRRQQPRIVENLPKCNAIFESPVVRLITCLLFGLLLSCSAVYLTLLYYRSNRETKELWDQVT